jgi:hypothetical protein
MESASEERAGALVAVVVPAGVGGGEVLHGAGQIRPDAAHEEVHVVRHQAVGVHLDAEAIVDFAEQELVVEVISIVAEDVLAVRPTVGEVMPALRFDEAKRSWHRVIMNAGCDRDE